MPDNGAAAGFGSLRQRPTRTMGRAPECAAHVWAAAKWALAICAVLAAWQVLGDWTGWGRMILSTPERILSDVLSHPGLYGKHILATVKISLTGLAIGASVAFVAALAFCFLPLLELSLRGVNIAVYTMPSIVLGPLLVLFFKGGWPQTALAAMMVYFPAMTAILLGLNRVDRRYADLIETYGGDRWTMMRRVRLPGALPHIFAALRIAAPIAVLGAVLGEFGSGARFGLGSFLLSTLPQGNPARLWAIGMSTSGIALLGFLAFLLPERGLAGRFASATLSAETEAPRAARLDPAQRVVFALIAAGLPFLIWELALKLSGLSTIIAPGPGRTIAFAVSPMAAPIWNALGVTLPLAGLGIVAGLSLAFALASLTVVAPRVARAVLPVAMVVQNTPLVAMVPFVVLVFGRGMAATVFLAAIVVFFPAFVLIAQGFAATPAAARDLVRVYGGGRTRELFLICAPWSVSNVFAAARIVAPQALLGVMVAEWLVSGVGIGNLLNISRGTLDYDTIWAGAMISILISVAVYEIVGVLERKARV